MVFPAVKRHFNGECSIAMFDYCTKGYIINHMVFSFALLLIGFFTIDDDGDTESGEEYTRQLQTKAGTDGSRAQTLLPQSR